MIVPAVEKDGKQVKGITVNTGVFNAEEVQCVSEIWDDYNANGADACGYSFIVEHEGDKVAGFACYGPRDLADGVFDLYWIAVDPDAQRGGVGRRLITAAEQAVRTLGGRILIAETSGTPLYEPTRAFYLGMGYLAEARIKDFYSEGDDLVIFTKHL